MKFKSKSIVMSLLIVMMFLFWYIWGAYSIKACVWPMCRDYPKLIFNKFALQVSNKVSSISTNSKTGRITWVDLPLAEKSHYGGLQFDKKRDLFIYIDQMGQFYEIKTNGEFSLSKKFPSLDIAKPARFPTHFDVSRFGVRDFYYDTDENRIFVSVLKIDESQECIYLDVLSNYSAVGGAWTSIFKTSCWQFGTGWSTGGALAKKDDFLFLSIGDNDIFLNSMDDAKRHNARKEFERGMLGKIMRIDLKTNAFSIYASGFRNITGMDFKGGRLFAIENGPQGGDELNEVSRGSNYGFPIETMGVEYGSKEWIFANSKETGSYLDSKEPIFSWVPSIAPSDIAVSPADSNSIIFSYCEIFLSTLKDQSLYIVKLSNDCSRVVNFEKIHLDVRLRKLAISSNDGDIVGISTDGNNRFGILRFDK